ncbi:MAG TPA: hypothetical protein VGB52_04580 [Actinomycetota bacterium]
MRVAIAILMGLAIASIGIVMLRGMRVPAPTKELPEAAPPPSDLRVVFWCENCHTELLLLRKGSEVAPRHCGERMTVREEVARGP